MTPDELAENVVKRKAAITALDDVKQKMTSTVSATPTDLGLSDPMVAMMAGGVPGDPTEMLQAARGIGGGVVKGLAGPIQTGLDIAAPSSWGNVFTRLVNRATGAVEGPESVATKVGDFVGQVLPFLVAPEASLVKGATMTARVLDAGAKGALAGATAFETPTDTATRAGNRIWGGVGGALGGGVLGGVGGAITRGVNTRQLSKAVRTAADWVSDNDPVLAGVRGNINAPVEKVKSAFEQKSVDLAKHQDLIGPIPLTDVEGNLRVAAQKVASLKGIADDSLLGSLRRTLNRVAPQFVEPDVLKTRQGINFLRKGPGQYVMEGTDKALPAAARDAMLDALKKKNPLQATYTQVKSAVETLNDQLGKSKTDAGSSVRALALEVRDELQSKLDAWTTPQLKRQTTALATWRQKNLAPFEDAALKPLLTTTDPLRRANTALDIALGDDAATAKTAADLLGAKGRENVFRGAVKKALEGAFDPQTEQYDAAKFATFFDKKPGLAPFIDTRTRELVGGIKGLLTDSALRAGESPRVRIHPAASGLLPLFGAARIATGHVGEGMVEMMSVLGTRAAFGGIERLLNDSFGRNLLAAAAKAKPGTPRMGRIAQTIANRFGAPAAGVGSTEGVQ